ncbi:MAG: hypothetical protein VB144_04280 [Clostridia bacterium]|nr:hypothetical protein [Clostridia bacterium]
MNGDKGTRFDLSKIPRLKSMIAMAALGVILIIAGAVARPDSTSTSSPGPNAPGLGLTDDAVAASTASQAVSGSGMSADGRVLDAYRADLEGRIAGILSRIDGAGTVSVEITLRGSTSREYAANTISEDRTTEEPDKTGTGSKSVEKRITREIVLAADPGSGRGQSPILVREDAPAVVGVLVVAPGASDPRVRRELSLAAETLLAMPAHRVFVATTRK